MAFTFKKTLENVEIGKSLFDEDGSKKVAEIVAKAKAKGVELVFPVDYVAAEKFAKDSKVRTLHSFRFSLSFSSYTVSLDFNCNGCRGNASGMDGIRRRT
jgi:3-phosphoglycerate kinase